MYQEVAPGHDIGYLVQVPWMTENNLLDFKDKLKVKGACRGPTDLKSRAAETAAASLKS